MRINQLFDFNNSLADIDNKHKLQSSKLNAIQSFLNSNDAKEALVFLKKNGETDSKQIKTGSLRVLDKAGLIEKE